MALGKGLNSLIGDAQSPKRNTPPKVAAQPFVATDQILDLPIADVHPNRAQPRTFFDTKELEDLTNSIRQHGVLQPIVVTEDPEGGYELIAGERRTRASKLAGKKTIRAILRSVTSQERLELALIENIQRHDLHAIDEATAYRQLMDEFSLTQQQVAEQVGKSRPAVANTVRLLDLPQNIQDALAAGEISAGKARALLSLKSEDAMQEMFASMTGEKMSVRDVEDAVAKKPSKNKKRRDPNLAAIEKDLEASLGTKVRVKESGGKGSVTIDFFSKEEFKEILSRLGV